MDSSNSQGVVAQLSRRVQTRKASRENSLRGKLLTSLGTHEIFSSETWKAAFTELVATALMLFTMTTSIIACLDSHETDPKLLVPFAVFIILFLFLLVTVPLSGGHMGPVITCIAALKGVVTLTRALMYMLAQCIGSILGFFLLKCVMDPRLVDTYSLGGCAIGGINSGLPQQQALLLEFTCSFVLLFVGITLGFDKKRSKEMGLPMVCFVIAASLALAIFVSMTVTGRPGYAGVGLNPARCLGPALLHRGSLWNGHWVFWVGPFLACIIYYGVTLNFPKEGFNWVDGEYDVLKLARSSCVPVSKTDIRVEGSAEFEVHV
ncbi:aquaporin PIP-type-like [Gastrolobium bilobum]|uniref:aquaporin PIP-type-like n=1 Tax=Gastrolobium bilobum TaxID=150636 RepID=UPI002AB006DE|nr:aquaporin PIP-type-like [Gastrolobium bilobum]